MLPRGALHWCGIQDAAGGTSPWPSGALRITEGLESAFAHYGAPLFLTRKSDLLSKPLPALVTGAYDIVTGGFEADDVLSYLRTGLAGLSQDETDELENYVLLWRLRGNA